MAEKKRFRDLSWANEKGEHEARILHRKGNVKMPYDYYDALRRDKVRNKLWQLSPKGERL